MEEIGTVEQLNILLTLLILSDNIIMDIEFEYPVVLKLRELLEVPYIKS